MQPRKMMGFETPGDQRVPISVRDWNGLKLALWRSKRGWDIVERAASEIVERCEHVSGCPGAKIETEPCFSDLYDADGNFVRKGCHDREVRMSALVVLNAARMFAPIDARVASDQYFAPSRESFSETVAELASTQIENDALREALRRAGAEVPQPSENTEQRVLPARVAPQLVEYDEPDDEDGEAEDENAGDAPDDSPP